MFKTVKPQHPYKSFCFKINHSLPSTIIVRFSNSKFISQTTEHTWVKFRNEDPLCLDRKMPRQKTKQEKCQLTGGKEANECKDIDDEKESCRESNRNGHNQMPPIC